MKILNKKFGKLIRKGEIMDLELLKDIEEGEDKGAEPTFSYKEAADILNVNPSTISHAVSNGKISTVNTGGKWDRIPASQVTQYGIRRGMDVQTLQNEIKQRTGATDDQFFKWILIGLGLVWLLKKIS